MPTLLFSHQSTVLKAFAVLANAAPGKTNYDSHVKFIENFKNDAGFNTTPYLNELNKIFAGASDKSLGDLMLANLGLTSVFTSAQAQAYIAGNAGNRVGAILNVADIVLNYAGADANVLAAKSALSNKIDFSYNWSTTNAASSNFPSTFDLTTFNLTTAVETLIGTSGNDLFQGYIADNGNTLNSGDNIQGGAGVDTLFADIGASQNFAITASTTGVENVTLRVQANGNDGQDNNTKPVTVEIDAQRMNSVSTWTNSNSRADLVIEDVRIADGAKTKDVTIVMESTDPGNVDYGVYFDQHSLRNASTGNTTLTLRIMDTGAAGQAATAATPLLNNPYDQFKLGINGVLSTIQLDKTAVAAADTYAALLTVFQNALTGTGIAVSLGADFTVTDPISNTQVTGKEIVLLGGAGAAITSPAGSGWYNTTGAAVPPTSNIYTTYTTGSASVTELVTSTIVLDDVGRGSTGGDLVVGGLSVGATSTSRGVERFEIEVRDNSKLQTINSTNDSLREVTIKNGTTTNTDANQGVYDKTVANAGNLTVNGNANPVAHVVGETTPGVGSDAALPGLDGLHHDNKFGFTDVRLIDGSAMKGNLAFTAQITENSIAKYITKVDTANSPTADIAGVGNVNFNVKGANFAYSGGAGADTIAVTTDANVTASRTLTGRHDFTFNLSGGEGNDSITHTINASQASGNWVIDQKQNANITIDGGAGNDKLKTVNGGATVINAGTGNDTVYVDASGTVDTVWSVNAAAAFPADFVTGGTQARFLHGAKLTVAFSSGSVGVTAGAADAAPAAFSNGFEVVVDIPTGANSAVNQLYVNQAIKNAINNDAVLSKLLLAEDNAANTLTIKTLVDGVFAANDIQLLVSAKDLTTLTAAEQTTALTAYREFIHDSTATIAAAQAANANSVTNANLVTGFGIAQTLAVNNSTNSGFESDNTIDLGAGDDVLVLGTGAVSNDTLVFTGYDLGKKTVYNFSTLAAGATTGDVLDFKSYLIDKEILTAGTTTTDQTRIVTTINTLPSTVDANSVTVISGLAFDDAVATSTFAGLTAEKLLAAINKSNVGAANYAGILEATLDANTTYAGATTLIGGIGHAVVLVENNQNLGEYKAFELTFNGIAASNANADFSAVKLIGTLDFGNSLNTATLQVA